MPATSLRHLRPLARLVLAGGLVVLLLGAGPVIRSVAAPEVPVSRSALEVRAFTVRPRSKPVSERTRQRRASERRIRAVLRAARVAIGTPYVYGGEQLHHGFDCSGLVQWAWRHGGVTLPRTSYTQWDAVRRVGRRHLQLGDILFFFPSISHVAIYVGHGRMIEAPHTGLRVRAIRVYWRWFSGGGRPRNIVPVHFSGRAARSRRDWETPVVRVR
jgi:hypothetical protein